MMVTKHVYDILTGVGWPTLRQGKIEGNYIGLVSANIIMSFSCENCILRLPHVRTLLINLTHAGTINRTESFSINFYGMNRFFNDVFDIF